MKRLSLSKQKPESFSKKMESSKKMPEEPKVKMPFGVRRRRLKMRA